jgi:Mg-chelatase subunit ChlD
LSQAPPARSRLAANGGEAGSPVARCSGLRPRSRPLLDIKSLASAQRIAHEKIPAVVIDVESGNTRLGLSRTLADAMGAPCLPRDQLADGSLERAIPLRLG